VDQKREQLRLRLLTGVNLRHRAGCAALWAAGASPQAGTPWVLALHADRVSTGGGEPNLVKAARQEYGIEVVDIRLRRTNHPAAVREAIFERIRAERNVKVAEYQSEGERLAADIQSDSELEVAKKKAEAQAEAIRLRGQADAEAESILSEAQRKDPQFYAFLKKLEEYQRILGDGKTTLLLSTHREMFDLLTTPPPLAGQSGKPEKSAASPPPPPAKGSRPGS
jgi:membrane protease subunit HflC